MATNAPIVRVDRVTLTATHKLARRAVLFVMADAVNALMDADGIVYSKIPVSEGGQ